jgi:hypothetical protein
LTFLEIQPTEDSDWNVNKLVRWKKWHHQTAVPEYLRFEKLSLVWETLCLWENTTSSNGCATYSILNNLKN